MKECNMKLSIITVNLNNKDGLRKTAQSIVSQSFKDFEWIVIDGGSTDGSNEIIEQYSKYITYWVSEPDKGIYNAMNKGIVVARGYYLLFLNSGDVLYSQATLSEVFKLNIEVDILTGQVERMDNHQLLRNYESNLFIQLYKDTINHQGTFIKKELFNHRKYDEDLRLVSDWKFWIESIIGDNASVMVTNLIISKQDMNGVSSNISLLSQERKEVFNKLFPALLQNEINDLIKIKDSDYYQKIIFLKKNCIHYYNFVFRFARFWIRIYNLTHRKHSL